LFGKRVLRRIIIPKRDEIRGGWRKLYNEAFYIMYSLINIIKITKSRRIKREGHVECVGEEGIQGFGKKI
jgi:hypothetical protein